MGEAAAAARFIERLLAEPDFRARFRHDPATAGQEAGLGAAQRPSLAAGWSAVPADAKRSQGAEQRNADR